MHGDYPRRSVQRGRSARISVQQIVTLERVLQFARELKERLGRIKPQLLKRLIDEILAHRTGRKRGGLRDFALEQKRADPLDQPFDRRRVDESALENRTGGSAGLWGQRTVDCEPEVFARVFRKLLLQDVHRFD